MILVNVTWYHVNTEGLKFNLHSLQSSKHCEHCEHNHGKVGVLIFHTEYDFWVMNNAYRVVITDDPTMQIKCNSSFSLSYSQCLDEPELQNQQ